MRKKKLTPVTYENIRVLDTAAEGKSIAKIDNKVVFIPFAAPGDLADIEIIRSRKSYMDARITRLIEPSPLRVQPFCRHFGICGGCKWQHLSYEEQLKQKQRQVLDHLERIGKVDLPSPLPIRGSEKTQNYRNKLEFTFSPKRWILDSEMNSGKEFTDAERAGLGFHLAGKFDKVLDIQECFLQLEPSDKIRLFIKQYALKKGYSFYDVRNEVGFLRNIIIRNTAQGQFMLILIVFENNLTAIEDILDAVAEEFDCLTSLMYVVNAKKNDSIADLNVELYKGLPYLEETMPSFDNPEHLLNFRVGPKSFYQTNSHQAYELYRLAAQLVQPQKEDIVYDLYTGTGSIANFIAASVKKVVGIEYVEEAIADAKINSEINGIENTVFYAGDMSKVLTPDFIQANGSPTLIITDPPREGMHEKVVQQILEVAPQKIVYVSCNSATQARDLQLLDSKYKVTALQAVDMFPHTYHVENIALLERR